MIDNGLRCPLNDFGPCEEYCALLVCVKEARKNKASIYHYSCGLSKESRIAFSAYIPDFDDEEENDV